MSRHTELSLKLVLLTVAMFGFGFALVPVYNVFCDLTGLGGRTEASAAEIVETEVDDRQIRLEFIASVDRSAPFEFRPTQSSLEVQPGRLYDTAYWARNLTEQNIVSQAVPSVSPGIAAQYLKKVECFCFTEQQFDPAEGREMGVTFMIDPQLPEHIDTLTLSYALFAVKK